MKIFRIVKGACVTTGKKVKGGAGFIEVKGVIRFSLREYTESKPSDPYVALGRLEDMVNNNGYIFATHKDACFGFFPSK